MFSGYYYPFYRSFAYPGFNPWSYNANNIIGSAVSNQDFVNTGTAVGVNQISTPTVIW
jgi:hypothetical protein